LNNHPEITVLACLAKDVGHVAVHAYGNIFREGFMKKIV